MYGPKEFSCSYVVQFTNRWNTLNHLPNSSFFTYFLDNPYRWSYLPAHSPLTHLVKPFVLLLQASMSFEQSMNWGSEIEKGCKCKNKKSLDPPIEYNKRSKAHHSIHFSPIYLCPIQPILNKTKDWALVPNAASAGSVKVELGLFR